ncbi:MAG: glycosyltransferase family 2 protein [Planctomycetes bacterium]|nr:glycosyltransferase family 2 protein [Planctomycetota bacterium]
MYDNRTISVVIPAYNEEATIGHVVHDFRTNGLYVDEVVVVDNNCRDRTAEVAAAAGARVVSEARPGYGCALRRGLDEARGEILVLTEADGSFRAGDLKKMVVYLEDAGLVVGTRTTRQMVQQGANMVKLLRWGNVVVAKILELLWYFSCEPRLTDVGCTYRCLTRETWQRIRPHLRASGPSFSPEMMAEVLVQRIRLIEVPVNYLPRMGGQSKHSAGWTKILRTARGMLGTILRKRWEGFRRAPDPAPAPAGEATP